MHENSGRSPGPIASRSELIAHVYRTALDPQSYDEFMRRWEGYIAAQARDIRQLSREGDVTHAKVAVDDEVLQHFELGFQLLEDMGRAGPPEPAEFLKSGARSALILDSSGRVVWYNGAAESAFGLCKNSSLDALKMNRISWATLHRVLEAVHSGASDVAANVIRLENSADESIVMGLSTVRDSSGQNALIIRELGPGWRQEVSRILQRDLGLTTAEIEVVRLLADGHNVQEVAEMKSNAIETIRAHVKSALAKTGARSQAALIRLTMTLMRLVETTSDKRAHAAQNPHHSLEFKLNGRIVPVFVFGAPRGQPILFLHGMLDGCGVTPRMNSLLEQKGLKLIAPMRPGFGTAAQAPGPINTAPARFGDDMAALAQEMNLENAILMGHLAGSLYAFAAAAKLGARAKAIINVGGGVPILDASQFGQMSARQRVVAWTARFTPLLLPFVLRAGIRQLDNGGEEHFAKALYQYSSADCAALNDPEVNHIVKKAYRVTIAQGHKAFEIDAWHVVRDWSNLADAVNIPVKLVHGEHDPVVSISSVRAFSARRPEQFTLSVAQDCGQLVLYARPELVLDELEHI